MRLVIESFANLSYLVVIIIHGLFFIKNSLFTTCTTRSQKFIQSFYVVSILFLAFHEFQLLRTIYKRKVVELENTLVSSKLKFLQYIGENVLTSVVVFSLALILETFKNFQITGMKDRVMLKYSSILYGSVRIPFIAFLIFNVFNDLSFYCFLIELFMISEFFVLMLIYINLNETINKIETEVDVCLMNDKSYVQYILGMLKTFSNRFIIATCLECLYRLFYIAVMINNKSRSLLLLKDISSLLKIISIHFLLSNINNLIQFNDPSITVKCDEDIKDKFFAFEEDNNKLEA